MTRDKGFTLLETLLAMFVFALSSATMLALWTNVSIAAGHVKSGLDNEVMISSLDRVFGQDCHSAVQAVSTGTVLNLTMSNGMGYRYAKNSAQELVRVATSGGTSVMAVHVASFAVEVETCIHLHVEFADGEVWDRVYLDLNQIPKG